MVFLVEIGVHKAEDNVKEGAVLTAMYYEMEDVASRRFAQAIKFVAVLL